MQSKKNPSLTFILRLFSNYSFQQLHKSYADLKTLVEETGEILQTIITNNLLPYENIQILKNIYDSIQDDFLEKLRIIEEILQDLMNNNEKWIQFNDELKRLETLFQNISSMFDSKSFQEKSLEEKQQILQVNYSFRIR